MRQVGSAYTADRSKGREVRILGIEDGLLTPDASQEIVNHSDVFNWGDGGSGSAQLALALLFDVIDDADFSRRVDQRFLWDFIAPLPDHWHLQRVDIEHWIKNAKNALGERF